MFHLLDMISKNDGKNPPPLYIYIFPETNITKSVSPNDFHPSLSPSLNPVTFLSFIFQFLLYICDTVYFVNVNWLCGNVSWEF